MRHVLGLLLLLLALDAHAQRHLLDIPADDLGAALERLADAVGLQLVYPAELTRDRRSPALRGEYGIDEALARLLDGSGLVFRRSADGTVLIEREGAARSIGAVRVSGVQMLRAQGANGSSDRLATEGRDSYAAPGAAVAGYPQALADIPRAVTVLGQAQMRDQGIAELSDAVQRLPGVAVEGQAGASVNARSRGQDVEYYQVDGGATLPFRIQRVTGDLSAYDRIELLRGPDGVGNGFTSPAGVLNLVRKRPLDRPQVVVETRAGSWQHYRGMLDASAPLGWDGRLRGRGVISGVDRDTFYDHGFERRLSYYGIVEAEPLAFTRVAFGVHYDEQRGTPYESGGLPRFASGEQIEFPRSRSFIPPWNFEHQETLRVFTDLDLSFGPDWTLRLALERIGEDRDSLQSPVAGDVDEASGDGLFTFTVYRENDDVYALANLGLLGRFELFGRSHGLAFGMQYADYERHEWFAFTDGSADGPINAYSFDPAAQPRPEVLADARFRTQDQRLRRHSASLTATLNPWAPLELVGTLRSSTRSNRAQTIPTRGGVRAAEDRQTGVSYLAARWALAGGFRAYASWAEVYRSNDQLLTDADGTPAPTVGDNYEVGLKFGAEDGRLQALLALYRTERSNFPRLAFAVEGSNVCCFESDPLARERIQGVEAEIGGALLPGWQLAAGYGYARHQYRGDGFVLSETALTGATIDTLTPRHAFRLWTTWRPHVSGWNRLRLGAGLTAQSQAPERGLPVDAQTVVPRQDGYAVADALVGWRLAPQWDATLNARNLFDRRYFAAVDRRGTGGGFYGEPRSFMLGLRGSF